MHLLAASLLCLCTMIAAPALCDGERPGRFDYYVLSLSWSPSWCRLEGSARRAPQCDAGSDLGWVLHGLWPQYRRGWPARCPTSHRPPSRAMTREMADIMGAPGLAWHQWKKHGSCSGLSAADYFALSRQAFRRFVIPATFARLDHPVRLPAAVIEEAFLKANPGLTADKITVTCRSGLVHEVRICLSRTLDPVPCGPDVSPDCRLEDALLPPIP